MYARGGAGQVVIDAAPGVRGPRSVIVINNGVLAIWPQTSHFVSPQSSLDKWGGGGLGAGQVVRIKRNRCSREESPRWEASAGNMLFFFFLSFYVLFLPSCLEAGGCRLPGSRCSGRLTSRIRVVGFGHQWSHVSQNAL